MRTKLLANYVGVAIRGPLQHSAACNLGLATAPFVRSHRDQSDYDHRCVCVQGLGTGRSSAPPCLACSRTCRPMEVVHAGDDEQRRRSEYGAWRHPRPLQSGRPARRRHRRVKVRRVEGRHERRRGGQARRVAHGHSLRDHRDVHLQHMPIDATCPSMQPGRMQMRNQQAFSGAADGCWAWTWGGQRQRPSRKVCPRLRVPMRTCAERSPCRQPEQQRDPQPTHR